jgi:hypothetical protein
LFGVRAHAAYSYFLVTAVDAAPAAHGMQLREWLRGEARQTQLDLEQLVA